jgi:hypothetical protein
MTSIYTLGETERMERGVRLITGYLPKPKVKASQFPVHISYLLQNCKKGKPRKVDLPY